MSDPQKRVDSPRNSAVCGLLSVIVQTTGYTMFFVEGLTAYRWDGLAEAVFWGFGSFAAGLVLVMISGARDERPRGFRHAGMAMLLMAAALVVLLVSGAI